ncbi:hypothetical protein P3S67_009085 [Capsicum chacoense]
MLFMIVDTQQQDHKKVVKRVEDGWRTPTSKEHTIPMKYPKAPRKAKSISVLAATNVVTKRKRKMFFDVYNGEVELLFPPALLADLIKKTSTTTSTIL